jgi:hypothetical protein
VITYPDAIFLDRKDKGYPYRALAAYRLSVREIAHHSSMYVADDFRQKHALPVQCWLTPFALWFPDAEPVRSLQTREMLQIQGWGLEVLCY